MRPPSTISARLSATEHSTVSFLLSASIRRSAPVRFHRTAIIATAPTSCTFNQSINVSSGQTCYFLVGSNILGNVKVVFGGNFTSDDSTISGNLDSDGGDVTL